MNKYIKQINAIDESFDIAVDLATATRLTQLKELVAQMQEDEKLKKDFAIALCKLGYSATNIEFVADMQDSTIDVRFQDSNYMDKVPYNILGYICVPFDYVTEE